MRETHCVIPGLPSDFNMLLSLLCAREDENDIPDSF